MVAVSRHRRRRRNVIIQSYDLTSEEQRNSFLRFREKVLEILESAYGERYYGHDVHLRRLYGESAAVGACHALLAFLGIGAEGGSRTHTTLRSTDSKNVWGKASPNLIRIAGMTRKVLAKSRIVSQRVHFRVEL